MLDVIQPAILSVWCPLGRVAISLAHIALCPPQGATNVWGDLLLRGRRGKHDVWKTLPRCRYDRPFVQHVQHWTKELRFTLIPRVFFSLDVTKDLEQVFT